MRIKTLAVPSKQQHFKLLFILPIAVDNHQQELKEAVSCINQKLISLIIATHQKADFEKTKLLLKLPKFKIEYEANLNDIFRSLEIKDAFDKKNADFSAMSMQSNGLYLDEVVHKAFVEISEEGTQAAAATRVKMSVF